MELGSSHSPSHPVPAATTAPAATLPPPPMAPGSPMESSPPSAVGRSRELSWLSSPTAMDSGDEAHSTPPSYRDALLGPPLTSPEQPEQAPAHAPTCLPLRSIAHRVLLDGLQDMQVGNGVWKIAGSRSVAEWPRGLPRPLRPPPATSAPSALAWVTLSRSAGALCGAGTSPSSATSPASAPPSALPLLALRQFIPL